MGFQVIESTVLSKQYLTPRLEAFSVQSGIKTEKELTKECVIVGRSESADVVIGDGKLSRNHFMIFNRDGKYQVKDLDSTNGIIVNGKKTSLSVLTGSDEIKAGNTIFRFMLTNNNYSSSQPSKNAVAPSQFLNFTFDNKFSPDRVRRNSIRE